MASSKVPVHAQAHIAKCTLCDRDTDARFFCTNCSEEMCKQCKTTHLRSKATRDHYVVSSAEDKDTSLHDVKINCTVHRQEPVQMYCINCEVLVCLTCIADKHKNHAFDKLDDVTEKYTKKISIHVTKMRQQIQRMKSNIQSLEGNKKDYIKDTNEVVHNINKQREEWKSQADTIADCLIQQVQDCKNHDLQQIDKQCKEIQDLISEKENMLRSYEEINQSAKLDSIIKCAINDKKDDKASPLPVYGSSPRFVTEGIVDLTEIFSYLKIDKKNGPKSTSNPQNVNVMKKMYSKSVYTAWKSFTVDKTVVAEFIPKQSWISAMFKPKQKMSRISVTGDNHAWVYEYAGNNVMLVDIDGNVIKNLPLDRHVHDLKATTKGDLFIVEIYGTQIQKYNTDGKRVTINIADGMLRSSITGLCIASDNDLLVILHSSSKHKVVRITQNGQVTQTIEYDQHKQPLYVNPEVVTENINGDVCVVDNRVFSGTVIVVVNKHGSLKFRYPDAYKSPKTIQGCNAIACDKLGFILIGDCINDQIHQIDRDGQFIQYILTDQHGIKCPSGLDVDTEGKLWICENDGDKVKVVKYRS